MHFTFTTVIVVLFFFFFELVVGASIRARAPYCCKNKLQARSLPENSLLRKQTSTSASWSWVGTECTIYPPEWVDPTFECESNVMYCTNTLQGSFGGTAVNCVPAQ